MREVRIEYVYTAPHENGRCDVMVIEGEVAAVAKAARRLGKKIHLDDCAPRRNHENQLRLVFRGTVEDHMKIFEQICTAARAIIALEEKG
jgi:hypothetical protein